MTQIEQLDDTDTKVTTWKVIGDSVLINHTLDYLYKYHYADRSKDIWFDLSFYEYCKQFVLHCISEYNHDVFVSSDTYDIELNQDGAFYLTMLHYN